MKKVTDILQWVKKTAERNGPALLTGTTVVGIFATGIASYRAGLKADEILERYSQKVKGIPPYEKEERRRLTNNLAKELAPIVLPPFLLGITTAACAIGSNSISNKKIAVLSAAYSLSEEAVKNLNGKMTELVGTKKTQAIKESITKDKFEKDSRTPAENAVILTGKGDVLCKDLYSGRYFRSTAERLGQAINEISARVMGEIYVPLNDLYELIGLPSIPLGDDLGWNVEDLSGGRLPISFTALLTEDNNPCLCLDYDIRVRCDSMPFY